MKDLTPVIRRITSIYGKDFIANDDFLDVLKSSLPTKEVGLEQKLFVYTVLRDKKVLSELISMQKKDIPKFIEREISFLSANYGLEEYLISTVFKELLVGSGIAQEKNEIDGNNSDGTPDMPKSTQRLQNKLAKSKNERKRVNKQSVCLICTLFWTLLCLLFLPLIPASIEEEFDLPGIIPTLIHYTVSILPLLFLLTSSKQSQTRISVAGGVFLSVVIFAGLFLSFGFFDYHYYPYLYEYSRDMSQGDTNVGQLIANNLGVIILSMVITSVVSLFKTYIFFRIREQKISEIITIFRRNKLTFILSSAISTALMIAVGYLVLKYGIVELLVDIAGEVIANVYIIMIAFAVLICLLVFA